MGGSISTTPPLDRYATIRPPEPGTYVIIHPATPIRSAPTLKELGAKNDRGELGTGLCFGETVQYLGEAEAGYGSVALPTHGFDPIRFDSPFKLGVETHKLEVLLPSGIKDAYTDRPDAVVIVNGFRVRNLLDGTELRLPFGSRLHNVDKRNSTFFIGEGDTRVAYEILDPMRGLRPVTREGVFLSDVRNVVKALKGVRFGWGENSTDASDLSGWIQRFLGVFGVHVPHNIARMEGHFRQIDGVAKRIERFNDLQSGDIIFFKNKNTGNLISIGMFAFDDRGLPCFHHCPGKLGWQANYLTKTESMNESSVVGQKLEHYEIHSAYRPINVVDNSRTWKFRVSVRIEAARDWLRKRI